MRWVGENMKLDGIINLHNDMKQKGKKRTKFRFSYNEVLFDVLYLTDTRPFLLMFGIINHNFYFEIKLQPGFNIFPRIPEDKFDEFMRIMNFRHNPGSPFKSSYFFEQFDRSIPNFAQNNVKPQDVARHRNNIEDADKIYFIGWRNNNEEKGHVSPENLEKTRTLISEDAYIRCKDNNISSRWSPYQVDEIDVFLPEIH